ncbi:MAG: hypothetical protein KAY65_02945 [Planctomycetes bacterium]|nr:hypothetical protein [Planctomycetota bacterium]
MSNSPENKLPRSIKKLPANAIGIVSIVKNSSGRCARILAVFLLVLVGSIGAVRAIANGYSRTINVLSEHILCKAEELSNATRGPVLNSAQVEDILSELRGLIGQYEKALVFAQSPYPGEILLGTTPAGDSTWLETLASARYDGFLKEIRIRRTGLRAKYLRINDIEIIYNTPDGPQKHTFNQNGRVKLHHGGIFKLPLPRPMRIRRVRININHESTGLEVYGIPHDVRPVHPVVEENHYPGEVLLGTTPAGDSTWLETLCPSPYYRPIREIRLRRTGRKAPYLRINDIEVTHITPQGLRKAVFNKGARAKLYYDGLFRLILPRPMRITRIRILINHESTGLKVYASSAQNLRKDSDLVCSRH